MFNQESLQTSPSAFDFSSEGKHWYAVLFSLNILQIHSAVVPDQNFKYIVIIMKHMFSVVALFVPVPLLLPSQWLDIQ